METAPVLNLKYLLEIADGHDSFVAEILEIFAGQLPAEHENMKKALADSDWATVRNIAHKLKSSAGNLGIQKAYSNFARIEELSQNRTNLDQLPGLIGETMDLCNQALIEVNAYLKKS